MAAKEDRAEQGIYRGRSRGQLQRSVLGARDNGENAENVNDRRSAGWTNTALNAAGSGGMDHEAKHDGGCSERTGGPEPARSAA